MPMSGMPSEILLSFNAPFSCLQALKRCCEPGGLHDGMTPNMQWPGMRSNALACLADALLPACRHQRELGTWRTYTARSASCVLHQMWPPRLAPCSPS